jgi:hypothetical protein
MMDGVDTAEDSWILAPGDHALVSTRVDQDMKQLAAALVDGTKFVITTLQKFPFVLSGPLRQDKRSS